MQKLFYICFNKNTPMKKITIIAGIISYSLMSCKSLNPVKSCNCSKPPAASETHSTRTEEAENPGNLKRIAVPTVNRDTLYIEESLIPIFTEIWEDPKGYTKPVIMPLYLLEKDIIGKVEKIQIN